MTPSHRNTRLLLLAVFVLVFSTVAPVVVRHWPQISHLLPAWGFMVVQAVAVLAAIVLVAVVVALFLAVMTARWRARG